MLHSKGCQEESLYVKEVYHDHMPRIICALGTEHLDIYATTSRPIRSSKCRNPHVNVFVCTAQPNDYRRGMIFSPDRSNVPFAGTASGLAEGVSHGAASRGLADASRLR